MLWNIICCVIISFIGLFRLCVVVVVSRVCGYGYSLLLKFELRNLVMMCMFFFGMFSICVIMLWWLMIDWVVLYRVNVLLF